MNGFTDYKKKEYYKNYYLLNKEIIKSQIRYNYNNNKERINKKVECECGRVIIHRMMKKHLETNIHKKRLLLLEQDKSKTFVPLGTTKVGNEGWIYFQ